MATDIQVKYKETPPHTWGRPDIAVRKEANRRNTPTYMGKTTVQAVKEMQF